MNFSVKNKGLPFHSGLFRRQVLSLGKLVPILQTHSQLGPAIIE